MASGRLVVLADVWKTQHRKPNKSGCSRLVVGRGVGGRPVIPIELSMAMASTHLTGTSSGVCFSFSDMLAGSLERQKERGRRERGGEGWSEKRERGGWEEELLAGGSYLNTAVTRVDGL